MRSRSRLALISLFILVFCVLIPLQASAQTTEILDASGDGGGATLNFPQAIAVDAVGNVYVGAVGSDNVFKVTPSGTITQIIDSTGDGLANLINVFGVAVDANGNAFAAGNGTHNAFKITPGGTITEVIDSSSGLSRPSAMVTDASGNLFVTGELSDNVYKITPGGTITEILDATGDGAGNSLDGPSDITVDVAGNVYVTGRSSRNAFKITPAGTISEIIDSSGDGDFELFSPDEIAVDSFNNAYVRGNSQVYRITPAGTVAFVANYFFFAGNATCCLAVDSSGRIYLGGDESLHRFSLETGAVDEIIPPGSGISLDSRARAATIESNRIYVTGNLSDNVFEVIVDAPVCKDGVDNDFDGLTDFPDDPGCEHLQSEIEDPACTDAVDNDGDFLIDFPADPGCQDPFDETEDPDCNDGVDNDMDGSTDFPSDPGCSASFDTSELNSAIDCDDGIDNDGDGLSDVNDPGCFDSTDGSELNPAIACDDGIDNDGDGIIDSLDAGCDDPLDGGEQNPALVCDDGIDNDGDTRIDFPADGGCQSQTDDSEFTLSPPRLGSRVWTGSLELKLGKLPPLVLTGAGVATLSFDSEEVTTLDLGGGITGTVTVPVTDPEVTSTIASFRLTASLGSGQLAPFSMPQPLTQQVLPIPGFLTVCIVFAGCDHFLPLQLVALGEEAGIGIGGVVTVGFPGPVRLSMFSAPWTLGTATLISSTANGAELTVMDSGFIHGPASTSAATLVNGATLRLIAPIQILTKGIAGNTKKIALFTSLNIQFIPEPGVFLGLATGAAALMVMGRRARRRGGD